MKYELCNLTDSACELSARIFAFKTGKHSIKLNAATHANNLNF